MPKQYLTPVESGSELGEDPRAGPFAANLRVKFGSRRDSHTGDEWRALRSERCAMGLGSQAELAVRRRTRCSRSLRLNTPAPESREKKLCRSKRIEQRLGLHQIRCVEAFGEPVVDRREELTGFRALSLLTPEAGEASGGAEFPELRRPVTCRLNHTHQAIFRRSIIGLRQRGQDLSSKVIGFPFKAALSFVPCSH
jgi:hypothetical protein